MSLSLSVSRGESTFPSRIVTGSRFLVGSADQCDLRLGRDIPPEHSLILVRSTETIIEALVDQPPLLVNGRAVDEQALNHDDLIQIGPYQLGVCDEASHGSISLHEPTSLDFIDFEELTDLAGEWMQNQEQTPTEALLQELDRRVESAGEGVAPDAMSSEIELAMDQLVRLSDALHARADRLTRREAELDEAAELLLTAQQQVEEQIQRLSDRMFEAISAESESETESDDFGTTLRIAA